jgi:hypothetical protein
MKSASCAVRGDAASTEMRTSPKHDTVRAMFYVAGATDPGLLPRLIEPIAKLGHVPSRVHASREHGDGSEMVVDLRLAGVAQRVAHIVENNLRAVIGVRQVIAVVEQE